MSQGTRNFLIVIVAIMGLGCVCCIGAVVATGGAVLGGIGVVIGLVAEGPYNVGSRAFPANDALDTLLPPSVGGFTRESVSGAPDDGGASAVYRSGNIQLQVQAEAFRSTGQAQSAVEQIAAQYENHSGRSRTQGSINDFSYLRFTDDGEGRMTWNRGGIFFDVRASGGGDLDAFMEAFPY